MTFAEMVVSIQKEFPKFQVKSYLDNWLFRFCWNSLGWRMGATTLWNTVFMDPQEIGTDSGYQTLRHEVVHIRDQHRWPFIFFFTYFFILPCVLTMRAFWEWRGYVASMEAEFDETGGIADSTVRWVVDQFMGASYLWMFPFRGYMASLTETKRQEICKNRKAVSTPGQS